MFLVYELCRPGMYFKWSVFYLTNIVHPLPVIISLSICAVGFSELQKHCKIKKKFYQTQTKFLMQSAYIFYDSYMFQKYMIIIGLAKTRENKCRVEFRIEIPMFCISICINIHVSSWISLGTKVVQVTTCQFFLKL